MQTVVFDPVGIVGLLQMQCATNLGLRRSPTDKHHKRESIEAEKKRIKEIKELMS